MRVLFATYPEKTIFQYLAPLAWALRTAGHEVRVASQPGFADTITQAGLTAVGVGVDRDIWRLAEHRPGEREASRAGLPEPYDVATGPREADWEYLTSGYRTQVRWWHRMKNVPMIAGLVEFARYWRPDLVIWEPTTYAGSIAAKATGAAHARLLYCLDVYGVTREHYLRLRRNRGPGEDPMAEWLGGYAHRYGAEFSEDMVTGQFTIDQLPAPLRLATRLPCLPMRYVPYGGPATVPDWLWAQPERPRVALTLGLSATERYSGYAVSVASLLAALSDVDIELVATIADDERKKLPRIPDNTRVVPYVPLHHLAPTCAAVIHHAGAATLATASLHGLPQLALPFHFDQPALAARLAEQGAGLTLSPGEADGQAVREQLLRLLTEPSFRAAAEKLRDDMHTTPTPNQVVPRIEEFVARHRRQ